jgi:FdhD protein
MKDDTKFEPLLVAPQPDDPRLTETVTGVDESGAPTDISVVDERPQTL